MCVLLFICIKMFFLLIIFDGGNDNCFTHPMSNS